MLLLGALGAPELTAPYRNVAARSDTMLVSVISLEIPVSTMPLYPVTKMGGYMSNVFCAGAGCSWRTEVKDGRYLISFMKHVFYELE